MKYLFIILAVLFTSCGGSSSGGGGGGGNGNNCNPRQSEMLNPDWTFVSGQSNPPVTTKACEIITSEGGCSPNYCYYLIHKFCCFYWPSHPQANETGHISMTYYFTGVDDGGSINWYTTASIPGEAICDFDCP